MIDLNFVLQRYSDNGKGTQGLVLEKIINSKKPVFFSHVLEDEHRDKKLKGETRIPAGIYELKIRKEDTPLTLTHRKNYGEWFKYHIEVVGIKDFSGVYVHAGNKETHTDGCLLLNDTANNNQIEAGDMARSTQAVKRFYQKVYPHLESGGRAFIEIRDENFLTSVK
jgi:hypothetical protein